MMKLENKTGVGNKVKPAYNDPQSPFAIVLTSPDVSEERKTQLLETCALLDLVRLRQQINQLQTAILDTVSTP